MYSVNYKRGEGLNNPSFTYMGQLQLKMDELVLIGTLGVGQVDSWLRMRVAQSNIFPIMMVLQHLFILGEPFGEGAMKDSVFAVQSITLHCDIVPTETKTTSPGQGWKYP